MPFTRFGHWYSLVVDLSFNFPRTLRLTQPEEYAVGLKSRILVRGVRFALHLRRTELDHWRLGLVVPKRFAPRAIERNTIKRTWREAFRLRCTELQNADPGQSGCDVLVRLLPQKSASQQHAGKKKRKAPVKPQPLLALRREARQEAATLLDQLRQRLPKFDAGAAASLLQKQAQSPESTGSLLPGSDLTQANGNPKETPCAAP